MRLSILNLFSSPHEVLALAEMCDRHPCFDRFWVGEHHSSEQVPDPLALAFVLGGITDRIRIGTGATSLYYRNPYMVAETALMLELLYPGRLDLGVTKAAAANEHTAAYLTDGLDMQHIMDTYDSRVRLVRDVLRRERAGLRPRTRWFLQVRRCSSWVRPRTARGAPVDSGSDLLRRSITAARQPRSRARSRCIERHSSLLR